MGWQRPKTISDLLEGDWHLKVTCAACGRTSLFVARDVAGFFRSKGWNDHFEVAGGRFRCTGWPPHEPGCGHRGARLGYESVYRRPQPPKPEPLPQDLAKEMRARRG